LEELAGNEQSKEKVAILKYNDKFIGLSPVHDYIYQCKALRDMCLYDWVVRCERIKLPKNRKPNRRKKDEDNGDTGGESSIDECPSYLPSFCVSEMASTVFPFLPEHPLANSHGTQCRPVGKNKVPNFVGPTLPRCNQGDREFYCSIMLTLFKPWRSGLELKMQEQSWDNAFSTHCFSDKQRDVMRNLNI